MKLAELSEPNVTIGLALSGGGLRATLFHLGVLRTLRDAGLLDKVTWICSVSGGSILAAHAVQNWQSYISTDESVWSAGVQPLLNFVRRDVRGRVTRRLPLSLIMPRFRRLRVLKSEYELLLGEKFEISPEIRHPKLRLLTTNLNKGVSCAFSVGRFFVLDGKTLPEACNILSPAEKVAASSAYPVLFPPFPLTAERLGLGADQYIPSPQYYTDGGVYDNLAIRAFSLVLQKNPCALADNDPPPPDFVIVSDARGPFEWTVTRKHDLVSRVYRSVDIFMYRIAEMELEDLHLSGSDTHEWKGDGFCVGARHLRITNPLRSGTDVPIDGETLAPEIKKVAARIRTDLDRFSELEISTLVRLGQEQACHSLQIDDNLVWDPTNVQWQQEVSGKVLRRRQRELSNSARNRIHLVDRHDRITYANGALLGLFCAIALAMCMSLPTLTGKCSAYLFPSNIISGYGYDPADSTFAVDLDLRRLGHCRGKPLLLVARKRRKGEEERRKGLKNKDMLLDSALVSDPSIVTAIVRSSMDASISKEVIDCSGLAGGIKHNEIAEVWLFVMKNDKDASVPYATIQEILQGGGQFIEARANRAQTALGLYKELTPEQQEETREAILNGDSAKSQ